jgi:hypothetical protein
MSTPQPATPYSRMLISGEGWIEKLRFFLPYITENVDEAFRGLMYAVVESVRYRNKAMREIVTMAQALERNVDYGVTVKQEFVRTVKELAKEIYFQVEAFNLYNEDGILMYTYFSHPEPSFTDIILIPIIPLTYNPTVPCYEPRVY